LRSRSPAPRSTLRPERLVAAAAVAAALLVAGCGGGDGSTAPTTAPATTTTPGSDRASASWIASVKKTNALVWAFGDGADGGEAAHAVARLVASSDLSRILYLGDVYERGTPAEFRRFRDLYAELTTRMAPTPGNHEWPLHESGYDPFWRELTGRTPPPYYAFDVAGWRVLSLNSEIEHGDGSAQLRWLADELRAPGTCRIAYWHRPRFSAGLHNNQPDMAPIWDALRGHATIVLTGHDHDMQRFEPRDGITEFVSGAGGHGLYPVLPGRPEVKFADDRHYGALRLELRRGSARYAFVAADGRVLDRGSLRCQSS
jgi:hypothetical protein